MARDKLNMLAAAIQCAQEIGNCDQEVRNVLKMAFPSVDCGKPSISEATGIERHLLPILRESRVPCVLTFNMEFIQ